VLTMKRSGLGVVGGLLLVGVAGCGGEPEGEPSSLLDVPGARTENATLKFVPAQAQDDVGQISSALSAAPAATAVSRTVSVFFPKPGQPADGLCWEGLTSDSAGNLYPIANAGISKLDRHANYINGKNDENFFANEPFSAWGVIDQAVGRIFTASTLTVRSAPFRAGATFTDLIGGLKTQGAAVAIKLFASGAPLQAPEAIASAADGSLYVVNIGSVTVPAGRAIIKISPAGVAKVFAKSNDTTARRMLAVDSEGTVFWSKAHGIDRFRPDGTKLQALPGPNDQPAFENPMGAAFDAQDSLYVVENFGCKKIYKYTEH